MISIIIPTYNRKNTIIRAINSVLQQTYNDIEIIVVDDNSNDNTEQRVKELNNKKIKYIKLDKNYGACYARNYGIKEAKGEYIAFQDSDDEWLPNKLECQYNIIKEKNVDVVFCGLKLYSNKGKCIKKIPRKNAKAGYIKYEELLKKSIISTQTIFGKKECFIDIMFDEKMPKYQDWDLMLRMIQKYKVFYIDKPLVNLYRQEDSISHDYSKGIEALEQIFKKNENMMLKNKVAHANYYIFLGECYLKSNKKYIKYFIKSLKIKFSIINILKIIKMLITY